MKIIGANFKMNFKKDDINNYLDDMFYSITNIN